MSAPSRILVVSLYILYAGTLCAQTQNNKLIVIAHRGDHTMAPENTLKAFQDAISTGVDYVEVDVRASRDGELVVMHDATLNRMTDGRGKVEEFSLRELRKLTVMDDERPALGQHRVPTFAEVLRVCKGKIGIYLDFKSGDIAKTWQLLRDHQMEKRVVVYINAPEQFSSWRAIAPSVPLMVSLPDSVKDEERYKKFRQIISADIVDGGVDDYTTELVKAINGNGQSVWIDVQAKEEDEDRWEKVRALGVQGMQTDHPRELVQWREKLSH